MGDRIRVVYLISLGRWKEAAGYCDINCYNLVKTNNDDLWKCASDITFDACVDDWSVHSWGDLACLIYYGERFPTRYKEIDRLKIVGMYLAWEWLYRDQNLKN